MENSPEIAFKNVVHGTFEIGNLNFWITDTHISMWVIMAAMICFAVIARIKINKNLQNAKKSPTGLQNVVELMVETFDRFVRNTSGEKFAFLGYWFFTVFVFLLLSNWAGLFVVLRNPTADWSTTGMFGIVTFFMIHIISLRYRGMNHIKGLFEPFIPVGGVKIPNLPIGILNIIGELAKPISLSFRLFGNILSGMILISIFYSLTPRFVQVGIPVVLHGFFDLAIGALQAFVFTVLSLTFIGVSASDSPE